MHTAKLLLAQCNARCAARLLRKIACIRAVFWFGPRALKALERWAKMKIGPRTQSPRTACALTAMKGPAHEKHCRARLARATSGPRAGPRPHIFSSTVSAQWILHPLRSRCLRAPTCYVQKKRLSSNCCFAGEVNKKNFPLGALASLASPEESHSYSRRLLAPLYGVTVGGHGNFLKFFGHKWHNSSACEETPP